MPPITIYTLPSCAYCQMAKAYFEKLAIPYLEYSLANDLKARRKVFASFGEVGVPLIVIGDEAFIGFDREGIENALVRLS
ncbi:MAG: glutaredoxin family protein [Candidatus Liptonbacteria bacterium]|nr:glutaredoxin family protein [Candidatus Liptonbacteria bacterium]